MVPCQIPQIYIVKSFRNKVNISLDQVHYTCSKKIVNFCLLFTGHHGLQIRIYLQKHFLVLTQILTFD